MVKIRRSSYLLLLFFMMSTMSFQNQVTPLRGWSSLDLTHDRIGIAAVPVLPEPWNSFFANNLTEIGDACEYPDPHKGVDPLEFARHYDDSDIDHPDHTAIGGSDDWALGVVAWAAENATRDLTELIKADASDEDLMYQFGFVCHYAADSTMPFHSTSDFDCQSTGNSGCHSRLEELVFQRFGDDIFANVTVIDPVYIEDPYATVKANIASGLALIDDYLDADIIGLAAALEAGSQSGYTVSYYNILNQSIIDRISLAVQTTANLWYTAIINAEPPVTTSASETTTSSETTTTSSVTPTSTTSSSTEDTSTSDETPFTTLSIFTISVFILPTIRSKRRKKLYDTDY